MKYLEFRLHELVDGAAARKALLDELTAEYPDLRALFMYIESLSSAAVGANDMSATIKTLEDEVSGLEDEVWGNEERISSLQARLLDAHETIKELEEAMATEGKAVELLKLVRQYHESHFYGADGEKNKRAQWRGVMRKITAALKGQEETE